MFRSGTIVRHRVKPEWGEGLILFDEEAGKVIIKFKYVGKKEMMANPAFLEIISRVKPDSPKHAEILKSPKKRKNIVPPFEYFIGLFLQEFPKGFKDKGYRGSIRDYKVEVGRKFAIEFSKRKLDNLIACKKYDEIRSTVLRLIKESDLYAWQAQMQLSNVLKEKKSIAKFSTALCNFLYNKKQKDQARFNGFISTLEEIGADKWPIATWFQFFRYPEKYPFLKPTETKAIAESIGFELNYGPTINWLTYSSTIDLYATLKDRLAKLKPEDMIDVQSFIWATYKMHTEKW